MIVDIVLEAASEEMAFGVVNRWHRKEGEAVTAAKPLVEIEADKTCYDVPAPATGVLVEVLAVEGDEVAVGSTLGTIEAS